MKCKTCLHLPVCKINEACTHFAKENNITLSLKTCESFLCFDGIEAIKTSPLDVADILNGVGLGEKTIHEEKKCSPAQPPTKSNVIEAGRVCPCCGKLLPFASFLGDVCDECGEEVCEDCIIETEDKKLCERCF